MRQLSTSDQMTQKLTAIGHRSAFNNEQSPYRIVSYRFVVSICNLYNKKTRGKKREILNSGSLVLNNC